MWKRISKFYWCFGINLIHASSCCSEKERKRFKVSCLSKIGLPDSHIQAGLNASLVSVRNCQLCHTKCPIGSGMFTNDLF